MLIYYALSLRELILNIFLNASLSADGNETYVVYRGQSLNLQGDTVFMEPSPR
jgi:hypothetical protein